MFDKVRNLVDHVKAFADACVDVVCGLAHDAVAFAAKIAGEAVNLAERAWQAAASVVTNEPPVDPPSEK
jgi:hypothetical protein